MKATHTPGPWEWLNYPDGRKLLLAQDRAVIHCPDAPIGCTPEDARLIASAPDLLEALEHLIRFCPQPEMEQTHYDEEPSYVSAEAAALAETIFRAQSAIAAARGE